MFLYSGMLLTGNSGRIPVLIDNTKKPPFPSMETSAELLYLEKEYDKDNALGFKDDLERSKALQWLFFWHGKIRSLQASRIVLISGRKRRSLSGSVGTDIDLGGIR